MRFGRRKREIQSFGLSSNKFYKSKDESEEMRRPKRTESTEEQLEVRNLNDKRPDKMNPKDELFEVQKIHRLESFVHFRVRQVWNWILKKEEDCLSLFRLRLVCLNFERSRTSIGFSGAATKLKRLKWLNRIDYCSTTVLGTVCIPWKTAIGILSGNIIRNTICQI